MKSVVYSRRVSHKRNYEQRRDKVYIIQLITELRIYTLYFFVCNFFCKIYIGIIIL